MRRRRHRTDANEVRTTLLKSLGQLESVMVEGRHNLDMELKRQMKLQEANRSALQDALSKLGAEYDAVVKRAMEVEEAALKDEERFVTCTAECTRFL